MSKLLRREFLQQSLSGVAAASLATTSFAAEPVKKLVGKKGIGYGAKTEKDWNKLKAAKVKWLYNWNSTVAATKPTDIEYIPMVWSASNAEKLRTRLKAIKDQGHTEVLGFNEPDVKNQANMTVDQALKLWPVMMESGLRLGSPGAMHPDREWMKEFMAKVQEKKYRVDFVCVHWYWHPNPGDFLGKLKAVHKLYNLPIWITEFAVADWDASTVNPNRFTSEQIAKFVEKVLPELEKLSWVERYAWFSSGPDSHALGPSALFDKDGKLTKVGEAYAAS